MEWSGPRTLSEPTLSHAHKKALVLYLIMWPYVMSCPRPSSPPPAPPRPLPMSGQESGSSYLTGSWGNVHFQEAVWKGTFTADKEKYNSLYLQYLPAIVEAYTTYEDIILVETVDVWAKVTPFSFLFCEFPRGVLLYAFIYLGVLVELVISSFPTRMLCNGGGMLS